MTHFVYPYKDNGSYDLLFSIRSIYKNFDGDFDITIIGDLPSYLNKNKIIYINNENYENNFPRTNVLSHQMIAIDLYDEFVNMNDDFIFIRKTNINDLKNLFHIGYLNFYKPINEINGFPKVLHNTVMLLKSNNIINFSSHVPYILISNLCNKMIINYNLKELYKLPNYQGITLDVLYQNIFKEDLINLGYNMKHADQIRIGFWRYNLNNEILLNSISNHKILNFSENGFKTNPFLNNYLKEKFNKKSPLEN